MELGKLRVDWEEIFGRVKANVPIGNHEAFESLEGMVLIGAAARGPMCKAAASEGEGRGGGGQEEEYFVGHVRGTEEVDVIGICDEHASLA